MGGLIPACAGKTEPGQLRGPFSRAHPRVCGENFNLFSNSTHNDGSSPRVRGKPHLAHPTGSRLGLIPACAGKTRYRLPRRQLDEAHPRVCGENARVSRRDRAHRGSSPRVRGKPLEAYQRFYSLRLIPACAGKTSGSEGHLTDSPAHPRVCGENAERSGVLTLRSVRSWKTLSLPSSLKVTHCRTFVQLSLSSIRL